MESIINFYVNHVSFPVPLHDVNVDKKDVESMMPMKDNELHRQVACGVLLRIQDVSKIIQAAKADYSFGNYNNDIIAQSFKRSHDDTEVKNSLEKKSDLIYTPHSHPPDKLRMLSIIASSFL